MPKSNKDKIKKRHNLFVSYFQEVISEAKKVSWPMKKQTFNLTLIVIVISIIISLLISLLDFVFNKITLGL